MCADKIGLNRDLHLRLVALETPVQLDPLVGSSFFIIRSPVRPVSEKSLGSMSRTRLDDVE